MGDQNELNRKIRLWLGFFVVVAGVLCGVIEMLAHNHLYHVILSGIMIVLGSALLAKETVLQLLQETVKLVGKLTTLMPWKK